MLRLVSNTLYASINDYVSTQAISHISMNNECLRLELRQWRYLGLFSMYLFFKIYKQFEMKLLILVKCFSQDATTPLIDCILGMRFLASCSFHLSDETGA